MPARSTTPDLGAVACTPYGGALPSDHVSSMTLTETQMRLPCGQWNSFATSTSLTSLTEQNVLAGEAPSFAGICAKAVPVRTGSVLTHSVASPAGLTRGSIRFGKAFCKEDGLPG